MDRFKGLFDSILDGSFKNIKRFNKSNNKNAGVVEVKDYQVRVVFDRIDEDKYAIISAFIKKCDNDKGYATQLEMKIRNYFIQKSLLKEQIKNPEYIKESRKYQEDLYSILTKKELNLGEQGYGK